MASSVLVIGYEVTACDLEINTLGMEKAASFQQHEPFRDDQACLTCTAHICTGMACAEMQGEMGHSERASGLSLLCLLEKNLPWRPTQACAGREVHGASGGGQFPTSRVEQGPVVLEGCRKEPGFHMTLVPVGYGVGGRALLLSMNQHWEILSLPFKSCIVLWPFPAVLYSGRWAVTSLSLSQVLAARRTK